MTPPAPSRESDESASAAPSGGHEHGHEHEHGHDLSDGQSGGRGHGGERRGRRPPRRRALLAVLAALAAVAILWRAFFFADETEYVYVTQFGEPVRLCTAPGLKVKWPFQSLWRFDRRLQLHDPPGREVLTADKENLTIDWFLSWRIPGRRFVEEELAARGPEGGAPAAGAVEERLEEHVRRFLQALGSRAAAEQRLEERIQAQVAAELGRVTLGELVRLDPESRTLEVLMGRVTEAVRAVAAEQYGVEVVAVRLKRFNYPEGVKPAVFEEIRSERERVAVRYRAEGQSEQTRIRSLAEKHRAQILAQARREALRIRGEGEARAMEISNEAHRQDPGFYELLKTLETYRSLLDDRTTVVLSAESPLLELLTRGLAARKGRGAGAGENGAAEAGAEGGGAPAGTGEPPRGKETSP